MEHNIEYRIRPVLNSGELNGLFSRVWDDHVTTDLSGILELALTRVCAYNDELLVGFVNVAWDGGEHAFLLDTAVDREFRHRAIGTKLVKLAIDDTRKRGIKWLHVDFEPHLGSFYRSCGFRDTAAGLIRLNG